MIYSRKHGFLFIKGTKVASASVEMALTSVCGDDDIVTPISPIDEVARVRSGGRGAQRYSADPAAERAYLDALMAKTPDEVAATKAPHGTFYNHMALHEVEALLGEIAASTLVFAVERSPYEKIISFANMTLRFEQYRGGAMLSERAELKEAIAKIVASGQAPLVRNSDRYRSARGTLAVRVLRFDNLVAEFAQLTAELGLPPLALPHAKRGMTSARLDPRELFEPRHLARVNAEFSDEFDAFGWPMIEAAP
jgi:hypothetical protein